MSSVSSATAPTPQQVQPPVSIVINNYNYGRYLRAAIDSALAQTYPEVEVIVVDDGSTDDSREIIVSYGKRIIPVIKSNGGQGSALNAGFEMSRGEIVMFLDADDELLPEAVDRVVKAWRPGVAKIQFQLELIDEVGAPLGLRVPPFKRFIPNGDIRDRFARFGEYPTAPLSGTAYAREALSRVMPLDETIWSIAADKPLVVLTPFFGDLISICAPLGRYRIHGANDSRLKGRHLESLHRRLSAVYFAPETICRIAATKGIALDPGILNSTSRRVKLRIASLRLDPKTHPIAGDTRFNLLVKGIRASIHEPDLDLRVRASQIVWFALMAVAPIAIVSRLSAPGR
ncbi:glycosyltransferase family 2 protein [Candidatus Binatus sp.]|uniref:glycosyltransferase family 2 protein n=1 Tax=Candidatus Binatus sp. TaxID=2811406 RepID=UPI003BB1FFC1